ncbi:MAG: hypothetical protein ACP5D2_00815 [Candidatus Nanoarchaeia archaeon]
MADKNFSIINIDKPAGMTSFDVVEHVAKLVGVKKASHFGTLDPAVTGVLPIALGRAVKLTGYFIGHYKQYIGILHIHKDISIKEIQTIINKKFTGKIIQKPPVKSRVKRQEREREVRKWQLLEKQNRDILFIADVQGGTYIRKLCSDLGEKIGGAHMLELRRIKAGIFNIEQSITLYELDNLVKDKQLQDELISGEEAIKKILPEKQFKAGKKRLKQLLTGKPIEKKDISGKVPDKFALFSGNKLIEIAKRVNEKDIIARPEFVYN